jgi:uncharacterized protein
MNENPCLKCGACCANFRVSFYWGEIDIYQIPEQYTDNVSDFRAGMKGTNQKSPHCICLRGEVGVDVFCIIYDQRPTPCRNFEASQIDCPNPRCNQARLAHHLPALPS